MFNFSKQPGNPHTTLIEASFTNKSQEVLTNFIFQAAVPKVIVFFLFKNSFFYSERGVGIEGLVCD